MGLTVIPWIIGGLLSAIILVVGTSLFSMWRSRDKTSPSGLWQINRRLLFILLILAFLGLICLVAYSIAGTLISPGGSIYFHLERLFLFFAPMVPEG